MISERDISEKFSAVWRQNFPLLTSNFIRVFNEAQIKNINSNPLVVSEDIRYDLISETAFNISELVLINKTTPIDLLSNDIILNKLLEQTADKIWKPNNYSKESLPLTNSELQSIINISNNIIEFINKSNGKHITFKPVLKGYSFIPDLQADLSIDDTLYEIKTVSRNFKSSDLKQLFIYLALKQVSLESNWKYAGLYNPRKGVYCKFNIKGLIYNLSGGKTPNEVFESLLNGLIRDIEIDSKF